MQYVQYTSYIRLTYSSGVHSILFYSFYDPTAAPSSDASITSTLGLLPLWLVQPSRGAGSAAFSGRRTAPGWPAAPQGVSCPYGIVASQGSQGHCSRWPRWSSPLPWRSARASFRKEHSCPHCVRLAHFLDPSFNKINSHYLLIWHESRRLTLLQYFLRALDFMSHYTSLA